VRVVCGASRFQSSYQQDSNFLEQLAEHTYFLLPLVFESTMPPTSKFVTATAPEQMLHVLPMVAMCFMYFVAATGALTFPWQFQRSRVCIVRLRTQQDLKDLALIRAWAISKGPSEHTSTHWWYQAPTPETPKEQCLEKPQKEAFARISKCETIQNMYREVFGENHDIDVLDGMNEVYVSSPHTVKNTSDEVFYTRHIDGPYYFVPFASCYRMIIGLDANEEITTKFPMVPTELAAQNGDVLAFDFHREIHYIEKNWGKTNEDFRIVLKVHHVVYPKWAIAFGKLLGFLSTRYNMAFRSLFLYTIKPEGAMKKIAAWNVVFWTKVVYLLEEKLGYSNIGYLAVLAALAAASDYKVFLLGTSFIHYCRYITTYYHRENVAYGVFKRDVLIYKALALGQLFVLYLSAVTKGYSDMSAIGSIAMLDWVMVLGGYALSLYTTAQLGVDGTYFGIELGFVQADKHYVQKFPYGVIPHPMILSQCVALLGLYRNVAFRTAWPYLVPAHVCFYLTHMVQEHFDIYKRKVADGRNAAAEKMA
jgi:isoprenylcysteine carboxyl methyltransferase (ICMT) family protein YpbQ